MPLSQQPDTFLWGIASEHQAELRHLQANKNTRKQAERLHLMHLGKITHTWKYLWSNAAHATGNRCILRDQLLRLDRYSLKQNKIPELTANFK
jgi:hypothetical protein